MPQMVPLRKQSKKKQRQYYAERRGSWYGIHPVTRTVPDKKAYDRDRTRQMDRRNLAWD